MNRERTRRSINPYLRDTRDIGGYIPQDTRVLAKTSRVCYLLSYLNTDSDLTREGSAGAAPPSVTASSSRGSPAEEEAKKGRTARSSGFFLAFRFAGVSGRQGAREERRTTPRGGFITRPLRLALAVEKQRRSRGTVAICIIKQLLPIAVYSESSQRSPPPAWDHIKGLLSAPRPFPRLLLGRRRALLFGVGRASVFPATISGSGVCTSGTPGFSFSTVPIGPRNLGEASDVLRGSTTVGRFTEETL